MPVNPNESKHDRILLYFHDGMWEQAKVHEQYLAWDSDTHENIPVRLTKPE